MIQYGDIVYFESKNENGKTRTFKGMLLETNERTLTLSLLGEVSGGNTTRKRKKKI